ATNLLHPSRAAMADFILAGYLLLHLAGYWLLAFNIWDRYLLPVLPLFVLLLARVTRLITFTVRTTTRQLLRIKSNDPGDTLLWKLRVLIPLYFLFPAILLLPILPPALTAARSGYPVGGDHGAYDGIDDVARFVHTLPPEGVLYDHWLSWEFNFYLFDRPLYISWFPTPDALATDLKSFGHTSPRYIVVPTWESNAEVRAAAAQAGFAFIPIHTAFRRDGSTSFVVYQLVPQPQ
ncbi:MAG: conserved rane protein of unknown function, partial [Anaerolineales bacterium]|nr:conserved rane protein of unknown function [Anaerolineales bacterium]